MYRSLRIFAFFVLIAVTHAPAQEIVWARQSEDVAYLEGAIALKMELDHAGNVYVLYSLRSRVKFEGVQFESAGETDILLIKFDADGHIIWTAQMGGSEWDNAPDLAIDNDNNVLVTGTMSNGATLFGQTLDVSNGGGFFVKITPAGDLVWVRQLTSFSSGHAITTDNFNNVIVGGAKGRNDFFISKYTPDGTLIWSNPLKYLTCCVSPSITDIKTDANANVIIIGDFTGRISFVGQTLQAAVFYSAFIFKLDAGGNYVWSNQIDSANSSLNDARSREIGIDPSGDIFMTGYFTDIAIFDAHVLREQNDIDDRTGYITRLSSNGNFMWATAMYGRDMLPSALEINPNTNEISICGHSSQWFAYDDDYVSSIKTNQSFVLTTDPDGNFKNCLFVNGESYPTYTSGAAFNSNNELFVSGTFYEDFELGCFDLQGGSWYTSFLFKSGKVPEVAVTSLEALCVDNTASFEAQGADLATSFAWYFPEGIESLSGSFVTTSPEISVRINADSENTSLTIVPYFECYPRTEFSSTLEIARKPDKPERPSGDTVLCAAAHASFTTPIMERATGYSWTLSDNLTTTGQSERQVDVIAPSFYTTATVQVNAENGCGESELSEPLIITVDPTPSAPSVTGPADLCAGSAGIQYTASSPDALSYGWSVPASVRITHAEPDSSVVIIDLPIGEPAIAIQGIAKGICNNSASEAYELMLTQPPPAPAEITGEQEVCAAQDETVSYTALPAQTNLSYQWTIPPGFTSQSSAGNATALKVSDKAQSGTVSVTVSNNCFTSEATHLPVTVLQKPEKPIITRGECDRRLSYESAYEGVWYKGDVLLTGGMPALDLTSADSGFYRVEVHNVCGSAIAESVYALPVYPEDVALPNLVTANADGYNDSFLVDASLRGSSLQIFNRWGTPVFQTEHYDNTWDGHDLAAGVYFFTLRNHCIQHPLAGTIHLVK